MSDKKIKFKLNVFDIIIIVAVIAVAAILVVPKILPSQNGNATTAQTQDNITYAVEIYNLPLSTAQKIKVGDKLTDKVKKFEMGEVTDVQILPYKKPANDLENGRVLQSVVPDKYKAIITIKAEATENETSILVGGGYEVKVGSSVSVIGAGYFGNGFITEVERGAE